MTTTTADDATYMRRALALAARGRGRVEPNPMVGCVIVRGGKVVAEGYHRRFGGPHAEVEALRRCSRGAKRSTVYVTLEPCCYHGKTPPCTDALIAAGVKRVVAAMRDPSRRVAGRGLCILQRAGIEVAVGVLESQAAELNAPYVKLVRRKRPWVILKWAQSLDGKIAARSGDAKWITDEAMRAHAHRVRGLMDAIIVGRRTAQMDDPLLTCPVSRPRRVPARIVLDSRLRTAPGAKLVQTAGDAPTWFFCGPGAPRARVKKLEAAGCVVQRVPCERGSRDNLSLPAVLDILGEHQMTNVLVEGGGALLGHFFDQRLADEVHVYIARRLIGGAAAAGPLNARGVARARDSVPLPADAKLRPLSSGWLVQARLHAFHP
jgi:diaminohydroxyphosphoribosylaminopyrimidine deaminase/5-amino-6-(5-phosphoribosylamino)uracil reductase